MNIFCFNISFCPSHGWVSAQMKFVNIRMEHLYDNIQVFLYYFGLVMGGTQIWFGWRGRGAIRASKPHTHL